MNAKLTSLQTLHRLPAASSSTGLEMQEQTRGQVLDWANKQNGTLDFTANIFSKPRMRYPRPSAQECLTRRNLSLPLFDLFGANFSHLALVLFSEGRPSDPNSTDPETSEREESDFWVENGRPILQENGKKRLASSSSSPLPRKAHNDPASSKVGRSVGLIFCCVEKALFSSHKGEELRLKTTFEHDILGIGVSWAFWPSLVVSKERFFVSGFYFALIEHLFDSHDCGKRIRMRF